MTVPDEYAKHIQQRQNVSALDADFFGDRISLNTGSLEIVQTDISLPGNSALPVRLGRRFYPDHGDNRGHFENWDLDIPSVHGVFSSAARWTVPGSSSVKDKRCSEFFAPPDVALQGGSFVADEYWHGTWLYLPGSGDQELLKKGGQSAHVPNDTHTYPVVTKSDAAARCVALDPTSDSGSAGEGFEIVTPDGTVYTLNHMASRIKQTLRKASPAPMLLSASANSNAKKTPGEIQPLAAGSYILPRQEMFLFPTRVTDRFGNTVTYTWSATNPWQLQQISANDGRHLDFSYQDATDYLVTAVSDGTRIWRYGYSNGLATVTLPDTRSWQFALWSLTLASPHPSGVTCDTSSPGSSSYTGTIMSPSGATATFTMASVQFGRSWVMRECIPAENDSEYAREPYLFTSLSITTKTITGPGLPAGGLSWHYAYGAPNHCWDPASSFVNAVNPVKCTSSSPTTRVVSVTNPADTVTRHTFGNRFKVDEGLELKTDHGWNGSSALRSVSTTYADPEAAPYAAFNGNSIRHIGDYDITGNLRPVRQVRTTQQGQIFDWKVGSDCAGIPYCFDAFGRTTETIKSSSLGYMRTEQMAYHDNPSKWVLGQVASVTCVAPAECEPASAPNGIVLSQTTYNAQDLPWKTYAFGKLTQTLAYYADGTLKTVTDGNSHTTTLSSWYRGVPRLVTYPDTATQSAVVNPSGWITSVTDEADATTSYGYDAMGRVNHITYPAGDSLAWNATSITFVPIANAEYGIATGHWRQTISTGNGHKVTYFDALWRPVLTREYDAGNVAATDRYAATAYDPAGNANYSAYPVSVAPTMAAGTWSLPGVHSTFDALGRVETVTQDSELGSLTTTTQYLSGFQRRTTDPRGNSTTEQFMAWDTPGYDLPVLVDAPEDVRTTIARDAFGKPTQIARGATP